MSFGGGANKDNPGDANNNGILDDLELEQYKTEQANKARELEAAEKAAELERLAQLATQAFTGARANAEGTLSSYGVDPSSYASEIDRVLNSIRGSIAPDDPNPGAYYTSAGQRVVDEATQKERRGFNRAIDQFAPFGFENTRVPNTIDDAVISAIEAEHREQADQYLRNLFARGVITPTGLEGGRGELDRQSNSVRAMLNEIGSGLIEGQRQDLRSIAGDARTGAQTYNLGQLFNPDQFRTQIDQDFDDFIANLGSTFRGRVSGPLFNTKGLAAIAGSAQHAQNTKFDPMALAGLISEEDEEENAPAASVFL